MNKRVIFFLGCFLSCSLAAWTLPIISSVVPTNGTCVSDCKITVNVTNTSGTVTYSLINYPTVGQNTAPQTSNIFIDLAPGTYTVGVYDATTAGTPVTAQTTVTTNYVSLSMTAPVAGSDATNYCSDNGTLNITFSGGKAPFRVKVTNRTTGVSWQKNITTVSSPRTASFSDLSSGTYEYEIQDTCGQWQQNAPGNYITVNGSAINISSMPITSFSVKPKFGNLTYIEGVSGDCYKLKFGIFYSYYLVYSDTTLLDVNVYQNMKFRIEYPAGSGIFNTEGWKTGYYSTFSINNYDPAQPNGNKYRVWVQHPCTGDSLSSPDMVITEGFTAKKSNSAIDYCTQSPEITIGYSALNDADTTVKTYGCGPYTVVLRQGTTVISTKTISATDVTSVKFTASDGVQTGVTYSVDITGIGTRPYSQTINNIVVNNVNTSLSFGFNTFDQISSSAPGMIGTPWTRGFNFIFCDFTTTGFCGHLTTPISGIPLTFKIAATGSTPAITRDSITLVPTAYFRLWTDIPWGTYAISINYGCTTAVYNLTLTQPVNGYAVDSLTVSDDPLVCGKFRLTGSPYFHLNGVKKTLTNEAYMSWMLIVDGPARVGTRASNWGQGNTNYNIVIGDLPEGTYKVLFYPNDVPVSTKIVNGKSVTFYPTTMQPCYIERTITTGSGYVRPVINIPLSGGISCSNGTTNMTITILQGSKPPYLYRYKTVGSPDNTYTPITFQDSNIFSNVAPGLYTVQVSDQCGSITTQNVRVFNGNEQFVDIIGEIMPGIICESREIVLSVLSIGPVRSYKWYYAVDTVGGGNWTQIGDTVYPGSPTYTIPAASLNDKGFYKVVIDNGLCILESRVHIIDVLPPAGTPVLTAGNSFICVGGSTLLTASTSILNPTYQWYKDSVPITGANSSTYTATAAGTYTVVVTPPMGCPSDPATPVVIKELIVLPPNVSDLSAATICSGRHPIIHFDTSEANVTYNIYTASSGGTLVGTGIGTGSALDITLTTTPSTNTTYYVGAMLSNCTSASRTPIMVAVSGVVVIPSVNITATDSNICAGASITFSAAYANGGTLPSLQWQKNNINISGAVNSTYTYSPANGDSIMCRLVSNANCAFPDTVFSRVIAITVNTVPAISNKTSTICTGLAFTIIPTHGVGGDVVPTGTTYTWTVPTNSLGATNQSVSQTSISQTLTNTSSPTQNVVYTVTAKSGSCTSTFTITVTVNNFPALNTEITGPHTVCVGNTIQLSNATNSGVWTVNNSNATVANSSANPASVTGVAAGKAYLTYTLSNGQCETKKTFLLEVVPATVPNIKIGFE